MAPTDKQPPRRPPPERRSEVLESEYGHSSGDRNTRTDEHDWKHFQGGEERTDHVDAGRDPSSDPDRRD